jgi:ABC-2 type transport system ATP-binding protein
MNKYVLEIKDMHFRFKRHLILDHLSLHIEPGNIYALVGPSGSGKTTLCKILGDELTYQGGEVWINGRRDTYRHHNMIGVNNVAFDDALYPAMMRKAKVMGIKKPKAHVVELLQLLDLEAYAHLKISKVSSGLQAMFGCAIAMVGKCDLIVLDEPMIKLDAHYREILTRAIRTLKGTGVSFLITSPTGDDLAMLGDVFGILNQGHIVYETAGSTLRHKLANKITFRVDDEDEVTALFPNVTINDHWITYVGEGDPLSVLFDQVKVYEFMYEKETFSHYFMAYFGGENNDQA